MGRLSARFTLFLLAVSAANAAKDNRKPLDVGQGEDAKRGKLFSLFSVVTFPNDPCTTATDSTMQGTCLSSGECEGQGGTADGNCAAGFGVCCMFTVTDCGSTISRNCTYVQNPGYPSSYGSTSTTCSYTINYVQTDICQLRVDFNNLVIQTAANGPCNPQSNTVDGFQLTGPTGFNPPVICGTNTNQHMYVETGTSTTSTTLDLLIGSNSGTRTWKIKVSQIECSSLSKAPAGCVKYFTGTTGTVKSFNFEGQIMNQNSNYKTCVRQEAGYCMIAWMESATTSPDPFQVGATTATSLAGTTACSPMTAMITIPNSGPEVYCGGFLNSITAIPVASVPGGSIIDTIAPFDLETRTTTGNQPTSGYSLTYTQIPCN